MKTQKILNLLVFALLLGMSSYGQQAPLTNIQKNINERASGLEQTLNFTLDTLSLKSDKNILRVSFLSHDEKDTVFIDVDAPEVKIPLYHFKKGRYTIVVYREDVLITVGANRLVDIPKPKNAIEDLEESILRSSLSEEEQIARNMKPLKKEPKVVEQVDTRVAEAKPKETKKVEKPKAQVSTRKQREPKVVSNVNKKNIFEIAAEREEAKKAARLKNENSRDVAEVEKPTPPARQTTEIEIKKVTYNLSDVQGKNVEKQTRADYRKNNLRPNGTRYEN
ncbi:hypothetical protein CLV86_0594 [Lacinutrix venerupis]|uniref:hypothetical protein n=1 Tax=Lacinutrix venerupis TaxID=1486034 RepID=UPI000EB32CDE|nr:hypothetical protein [Lacinutrix venerupis]RLJ67110.1 hypothetical protein CLV86_0594 [Lacinutrix venerupis]